MTIKSITIETFDGTDLKITRIDDGALVTKGDAVICDVRRDEAEETRRLKAIEVAKRIYGIAKPSRFGGGGGPNCTGSMVYDVRCEIERLADC